MPGVAVDPASDARPASTYARVSANWIGYPSRRQRSTFPWPALYAASTSRSSPYLREEVGEVPGAVADVDLRVVEIADVERACRPCGSRCPAPSPASAASARSRPSDDSARRVELRLLVDHRREQRRVEAVLARVHAHELASSGADSGAARTTAGSSSTTYSDGAARPATTSSERHDEAPHPARSSITDATNASSSSSEPVFS